MPEYNQRIKQIEMPDRVRRLAISPEGYPTPWFVQWFLEDAEHTATDYGVGVPDFRVIDSRKFDKCMRFPICWVCGEPLGTHRVFTIGPMCSINRVISEPPSHRECAEYSVKACPFLANPRMKRNEADLPEIRQEAAGYGIKRNPGAMCLWETRYYRPFRTSQGQAGWLYHLGEPERVDWYAYGRPATRAEVLHSIDTGFPELERIARMEGPEAVRMLDVERGKLDKWLPPPDQKSAVG